MSLVRFLDQLRDTGDVVIVGVDPPSPDELREAAGPLGEMDRLARLQLPGRPPALNRPAAAWAAALLYRACQFLAFREVPAEQVVADLSRPCPSPAEPSTVYSVDLTLSHLPRLLVLARGISPEDPLTVALKRLAGQWPLSSVGVEPDDSDEIDIDAFWPDRCLRQLYVDRIVSQVDRVRASEPRVAAWIQRNLGLFPEPLAPAFANLCNKEQMP